MRAPVAEIWFKPGTERVLDHCWCRYGCFLALCTKLVTHRCRDGFARIGGFDGKVRPCRRVVEVGGDGRMQFRLNTQ